MNTYNLKAIRIELISLLLATLNKKSKWYDQDKETIITNVNRMTRKELLNTLERQKAISAVTKSEIINNCIL